MTGGAAGGLGAILGPIAGLIGQNLTNQANERQQQNALNQGMAINQMGTNRATGNLQKWLGANPNPATAWGGIRAPYQQGGGNVSMSGGPGVFGGGGAGYRRGAPRNGPIPPGMMGPGGQTGGGGLQASLGGGPRPGPVQGGPMPFTGQPGTRMPIAGGPQSFAGGGPQPGPVQGPQGGPQLPPQVLQMLLQRLQMGGAGGLGIGARY